MIILFISVCSLNCSRGYTPSSICNTCVLTNICEAINPCGNASCVLVTSPDQYFCYCPMNGK